MCFLETICFKILINLDNFNVLFIRVKKHWAEKNDIVICCFKNQVLNYIL